MNTLERPLTLRFPTSKLMGKISETDVLDAVDPIVDTSTIEAIQLTLNECRITLRNSTTRDTLLQTGVSLKGQELALWPANHDLTNVTIKDAPVELEDSTIITALSPYGRLLHCSIRRGEIPKTNIMTGTRYLTLLDVKEPIPVDVQTESFSIRVFCDNEKTRCKFCTLTSHPSYKCPAREVRKRRCFRCHSTSHVVTDCPNDVVCNFCFATGHRERDCDERAEQVEKKKYGEYYTEIKEGREASLGAEDIHVTEQLDSKTNKISVVTPAVAQPQPLTTPADQPEETDRHLPAKVTVNTTGNQQPAQLASQTNAGKHETLAKSRSDTKQSTPSDFHTIIIGASLMNHVEAPEGYIVCNKSGAKIQDAIKLIKKKRDRT